MSVKNDRLERNTERRLSKLAPLAMLSLLTGCDAPPPDQEALAATEELPPNGYQLYVRVSDIDFTQGSGGTLFTIRTPAGQVVASAGFPRVWNSYCANDLHEMHVFTSMPANSAYEITKLPKPVATLKTTYAFAADGELYIEDIPNDRRYVLNVTGSEVSEMTAVPASERTQSCSAFIANGRYYYWVPGQIRACPLDGAEPECEDIAIEPDSFPYVYAEHDGRALVGTNWGDILIHNSEGWCRAENIGDRYACPPSGSPLALGPATPSGIQFYSSAHYQDKTYLGRYPDGLLYEFDGESVVLSADSPPSLGHFGTELQSLAIYCGDLFAGLWPRGMIWRRDRETSGWEQIGRLFSHPTETQPWVPYLGMEPEGLQQAFYGQRVTSLSLLSDSLFASTANLNSWNSTLEDPDFLTAEQAAEYGTIHRIRRPGCASAILPDVSSFWLRFDFTPERIIVRHRGSILVQVENNGTVPSADDVVSLGEGVFGALTGVALDYSTRRPRDAG